MPLLTGRNFFWKLHYVTFSKGFKAFQGSGYVMKAATKFLTYIVNRELISFFLLSFFTFPESYIHYLLPIRAPE